MARDTDAVEWLDAEQLPEPFPPHAPRRVWYLLLGAVVAAVTLVLMLTGRHTKRAASPPRRTRPRAHRPRSACRSRSVPPTPPLSLINLGHPLLHAPATWELVARAGDGVYQIQLATGRIARASAVLSGSEAVSFLVGPHDVVVRPWDCVNGVDGYLIRDGHAASALRGMLANCGLALPGPRPGQVWVPNDDQHDPKMVLADLNGRPTGPSMPGQEYARSPTAWPTRSSP